jgi:hypothetical protein
MVMILFAQFANRGITDHTKRSDFVYFSTWLYCFYEKQYLVRSFRGQQ